MRAEPDAGPPGSGVRWGLLPVLVTAIVWGLLLAITVSPAVHAAARRQVSWLLEPIYHDWWVVRQGWEVAAAGGDPLAALDLPFNYPRVVLLGAAVGAGRVPVPVAGLVTAALVLAGLVWLLRPRTSGEALLAAALVASPPVLLLLERGNLDAWAFLLVLGGVAGLARGSRGPAILGLGLLLAAAAIKLFPAIVLAGAAGLWRGWRRRLSGAALGVFLGWAVVSAGEIALILRKTTRGLEAAYGRMLAGSRYFVEVAAGRPGEAGPVLRDLMHLSLLGALAVLTAAVVLGWRWRGRGPWPVGERTAGWFVAGAAIYAGTFFLGHNWAYRLVFLSLCVPGLWRLAAAPAWRLPARLLLAGVAGMMVSPFRLGLGWFLVREGVAWALAGGLTAVAVALLAAPAGTEKPVCATKAAT